MPHQKLAKIDDSSSTPVHELCLANPNDISRYSEWDIDFRQIEPGQMGSTKVILRSSPRVSLVEFHMNRGIHQRGCSPSNSVTFGLPVSAGLHSWQGAKIDNPGLVNFGMGSEFECVSGPEFVALTFNISTPFLASVSDQLGLPLPDDYRRTTMLPVRRRTPALHRLSEYGQALLHGQGVPFEDQQQEDLVAALINTALDAQKFDDRSAFSVRAKSVTRAVELMKDRIDDNVSICQLCVDSSTPWRTLTRGFQERFGIGPKAYFNRIRLGRVRSELLQGRGVCSVADAANRWGFWHMGQLAKDYKLMFGELPSETLNDSNSTYTNN